MTKTSDREKYCFGSSVAGGKETSLLIEVRSCKQTWTLMIKMEISKQLSTAEQ